MFQHLIANVTLSMKELDLSPHQKKKLSLLYLSQTCLIRNKITTLLWLCFVGLPPAGPCAENVLAFISGQARCETDV